jgi:hypothetical protein
MSASRESPQDDKDEDDDDDISDVRVENETRDEMIERIYAENRRKAAQTHAQFAKIGMPDAYPVVLIDIQFHISHHSQPLYIEPSDTESYHQVHEKHKTFRPMLINWIKKQNQAQDMRVRSKNNVRIIMISSIKVRYLSARYDTMRQIWLKRVQKWESKPAKKTKDEKNREIFEKTFVELKKQREERERTDR